MEKAIKNRQNNVIPPLPKVRATSMDFEGRMTVIFEREIMWPESMNQK